MIMAMPTSRRGTRAKSDSSKMTGGNRRLQGVPECLVLLGSTSAKVNLSGFGQAGDFDRPFPEKRLSAGASTRPRAARRPCRGLGARQLQLALAISQTPTVLLPECSVMPMVARLLAKGALWSSGRALASKETHMAEAPLGVFLKGATLTAALVDYSPRGETLMVICAAAEILLPVAKAVAATNATEVGVVQVETLLEAGGAETSTQAQEEATSLVAPTSTVDNGEVEPQTSMADREEESQISSVDNGEEAPIHLSEVAQISLEEAEAQISLAEVGPAVGTSLVGKALELESNMAVAKGRTSLAEELARQMATCLAEPAAKEMATCSAEAAKEIVTCLAEEAVREIAACTGEEGVVARTLTVIHTEETRMEAPTPMHTAEEGAAFQMAVALLPAAVFMAAMSLLIGTAAALIRTRVPQTAAMQVKATQISEAVMAAPPPLSAATTSSRGTESQKGMVGAETPTITAKPPCVQTTEVGPPRRVAVIGQKAVWVLRSRPELPSQGTQRRI